MLPGKHEGIGEQSLDQLWVALRPGAQQSLEREICLLAQDVQVGHVVRVLLAVLGDVTVQGRIGLLVLGADLLRHGPNPRSAYGIGLLIGISRIAPDDPDPDQRLAGGLLSRVELTLSQRGNSQVGIKAGLQWVGDNGFVIHLGRRLQGPLLIGM